jgi:hypothetical protein
VFEKTKTAFVMLVFASLSATAQNNGNASGAWNQLCTVSPTGSGAWNQIIQCNAATPGNTHWHQLASASMYPDGMCPYTPSCQTIQGSCASLAGSYGIPSSNTVGNVLIHDCGGVYTVNLGGCQPPPPPIVTVNSYNTSSTTGTGASAVTTTTTHYYDTYYYPPPPPSPPLCISCAPGCSASSASSSCPSGTTGTPPNCTTTSSCPTGSVGTPPNCACPAGSVGTPPNCACPAGTTGTPPNCQTPYLPPQPPLTCDTNIYITAGNFYNFSNATVWATTQEVFGRAICGPPGWHYYGSGISLSSGGLSSVGLSFNFLYSTVSNLQLSGFYSMTNLLAGGINNTPVYTWSRTGSGTAVAVEAISQGPSVCPAGTNYNPPGLTCTYGTHGSFSTIPYDVYNTSLFGWYRKWLPHNEHCVWHSSSCS